VNTIFNLGLNTIYQILGRMTTAVAGLVITRLITYNFGLDGYGQYQIIITYVTLFWILTDFGFNAIAVREMTSNKDKQAEIYSALTIVRLISGLLLFLVSICIVMFFPYDLNMKIGIIIAGISIFFQSIMGIGNIAFQIKLKYSFQLISNLIGSCIAIIFVLITINYNLGIWGLAISFMAGSLFMGLLNIIFGYKLIPFQFKLDLTAINGLIKETLPFGVILLFSLLTTKIDAILLSILPLQTLTNSQAVGIYNLSYKLFEMILMIPSFFLNVLYPTLIEKAQLSITVFKKSIYKIFGVLLIGSILITVILYYLAPYLVDILTSSTEFHDSIISFRILILSTPLFFITALFMWIFVIYKLNQKLLIVYISSFVFNVISNLIFIPRFGYFAAAINTGLTELLILGLQIFFIYKVRNKLTI